MKTLQLALNDFRDNGGAAGSLRKHLTAAGIIEWEDFSSAENLYRLRDTLRESVATSTARTFFNNLKSFLKRNREYVYLPEDGLAILSVKNEKPLRTFLTPEELRRFESVPTKNPKEALVQTECLLEAYTGARVSDIMAFTAENIQGDQLVYVSKKTKIQAAVPVSKKILRWIMYAQAHREYEPSTPSRCDIIRRLCKRAGITSPVTVFTAGETKKGEKWQYITSHSFRISFVTNLQQSGMDLVSISRMSGHRNVAMTERYCAPTTPKLTWLAQEFLGLNEG